MQQKNSQKFTHLHVHTHYSLLDGLSKIGDLLKHVKEQGMDSVAITDHGTMYGAIEFYQKATDMGIKPILGLEGYVANRSMHKKEPGVDDKRYHLILLAKNNTGYKSLMAITSAAHLEGYYYKPRFDKDLLRQHSEGLIVLSGCLGGEIAQAILAKNEKRARDLIKEYQDIVGEENFYLEIQNHPNLEEQIRVNKALHKLSQDMGVPMVATQDSHYLRPEDAEAHDVLLAIQTGNTTADDNRLNFKDIDSSLKSPTEIAEDFKEYPEAVENANKIANECNVELTLGEFIFPNFVLEKGKTADQMLDEVTHKGLEERGLDKDPKYEKRLQYELEIINNKKYAPYFLAVADIIRFAQGRDIYTTVRGSVAGSLIAYVCGITNVDPIAFQLPFERFLNPYRPSAPDIDMDFADNRRQEVIEYTKEKYGTNNVAQICTFGTMMARGAVRDVARAMGKSYDFGDKIAKLIPMGSQGFPMTIDHAMELEPDLKKEYDKNPEIREVLDVAKKLEGTVRHASVHAAGVVISPGPLTEYTPLQHDPKGGENLITQYDMNAVGEDGVGLLKFDFLGIRNLAILENAVHFVKKRKNLEIDIEKIPFDDKKTFEMLSRGETEGLFQLNGSGMTKYLTELRPERVHDINAMIALYRPGPIKNIPDYIDRKHGKSAVTYFHPKVEKFLDKSYGVLVYQDDLLSTAMELAGYNWETVDKFRKAVGKKIPEEMAKQHEIFVKGCQEHSGMTKEEAEEIWDLFEPFQGYGFNKAHAACYGRLAYQTAYMKANFPTEYMCAILVAEAGDMDKTALIMAECKRMGINILPPSINESDETFTIIDDNTIRFGLATIKNVGSNFVHTVIEERNKNGTFSSLEDLAERTSHGDFNKKSLESLIKTGALDELNERSTLLENMEDILKYARQQRNVKNSKQENLFGGMETAKGKLRLKQVEPTPTSQALAWEKELLGFYISGHPLEEHTEKLQNTMSINQIVESKAVNNAPAKVGGIVQAVKKIITKKGDHMAFVTLEDLTGSMETLVFPSVFEKTHNLLEESKMVMADGKISTRDGDVKLICEDIKEL